MIRLSVMYPQQDGSHFDLDYYVTKHRELVAARWGRFLRDSYVLRGLAGPTPDSAPIYQVMAQANFDSLDALSQARAAGGEALRADVANFTNVTPIIQVSEILG